MSYNLNGSNTLTFFYLTSSPHIATNNAVTTNFRINNIDISNNYFGLGINSKIPVSQIANIPYNINGTSIGTLFELNLPNFISGAINFNYKIWPPNQHQGLLIQFFNYSSTPINIKFNYYVNIQFIMIGGGGGGGSAANSNAGGGGGAGEYISGNMQNYEPGNTLLINVGIGGNANALGGNSIISYYDTNNNLITSITANGGGYGGIGKIGSPSVIGSSSGGTGSYSSGVPSVGTRSVHGQSVTSFFANLASIGNLGALGNNQGNDTGAGGGGGGAGGAAPWQSDQNSPGPGGAAITTYFGNTSFVLGGGGGGGGRGSGIGNGYGGLGGSGVGGSGGGFLSGYNGFPGSNNTGSGGGGAANDQGSGGSGGSGTVIFYIIPSGVSG